MKRIVMTGNQFSNMADLVALSVLSDSLANLDLSAFPDAERRVETFTDFIYSNIKTWMKSQTEIEEHNCEKDTE